MKGNNLRQRRAVKRHEEQHCCDGARGKLATAASPMQRNRGERGMTDERIYNLGETKLNKQRRVAVGIVVLINIVIAGPSSGASMNPARSLVPAIVLGAYKNIWVYIIGPTLGAILASMVYMFSRVPQQTKP
ncbi:hypothetical protein HN51_025981 [Arachis hypogaea]